MILCGTKKMHYFLYIIWIICYLLNDCDVRPDYVL